jgi:hypothetical protein
METGEERNSDSVNSATVSESRVVKPKADILGVDLFWELIYLSFQVNHKHCLGVIHSPGLEVGRMSDAFSIHSSVNLLDVRIES